MKFIVILLLYVFLTSLVVTPIHLLSKKEKSNNINLANFHIAINTLFITWAFYDISYTEHYMLGLNTLFIIMPGAIGLFLYYMFGYRKVLKVIKNPRHALIIACMHLGLLIYGIIYHVYNT